MIQTPSVLRSVLYFILALLFWVGFSWLANAQAPTPPPSNPAPILTPVPLSEDPDAPGLKREERFRRARKLLVQQQEMVKQYQSQNRQPPRPPLRRNSAPSPSGSTEPEQVEGTLWPGESYTFGDVKITWKPATKDANTTQTNYGTIDLIGPTVAMRDLPIKAWIGYGSKSESFTAYLDQVKFWVGYDYTHPAAAEPNKFEVEKLTFQCIKQPDRFELSAAPAQKQLWVSHLTPVTVNEWTFSISEQPAPYPDGKNYYQLIVKNNNDGSTQTIPAVGGSSRKFGRFAVSIIELDEQTRTAYMQDGALADFTIQGGNSYGELDIQPEPYGQQLERVAQQYQFEVEWVEYPPGHPESIEEAKKLGSYPSTGRSIQVIKEGLERSMTQLAFEWVDARHVKVWAKDYDKVVARKEAEAKAKAEEEQKKKEAALVEEHAQKALEINIRRNTQAKADEWKQFKDKFQKEFNLETRIYQLRTITPVTAKALIDQQLQVIFLVDKNSGDVAMSPTSNTLGSAAFAEGGFFGITGLIPKEEGRGNTSVVLRKINEQCIADEKANAVIVTAIEQTHKKVDEIIGKTDSLLTNKQNAGESSVTVPKQYRIEAILLQGVKEDQSEANVRQPQSKVIIQNGSQYVPRSWKKLPLGYEVEYVPATTTQTQIQTLPPVSPDKKYYASRNATKGEQVDSGHYTSVIVVTYTEQAASEIKSPKDYGLTAEDLKVMGFDSVKELGRGLITLTGERGELGKAMVALNESYRLQLDFQEVRQPYVIVQGSLLGEKKDDKPLLSNTLFLEKNKPQLLGLTNLKDALILLVRVLD